MAQYREAKTPTSGGKKLHHIEMKEGEEGGHVVTHHYTEDGMMYHKPKEYAFGADEGEDVISHVRKHMHVAAAKNKAVDEAESEE